jgi:hypothetical protein
MEAEVVQNAIVGMLMGLVCGMIPMILAIKKGREGFAIASVVVCGIAGAVLGLILAAPAAGILAALVGTMETTKKDGK